MGQSGSCSVLSHRWNGLRKETNSWHFLPQMWLREIILREDCHKQDPYGEHLGDCGLNPCTISWIHLELYFLNCCWSLFIFR